VRLFALVILLLTLCLSCTRTVYVSELRNFRGEPELREWLANDKTNQAGWSDCDDVAVALQRAALQDGYLLNLQVETIVDGANLQFHMVCSVVVGNDLYYIEPSTDAVWSNLCLDLPGTVKLKVK
jgi:hypothetical protein